MPAKFSVRAGQRAKRLGRARHGGRLHPGPSAGEESRYRRLVARLGADGAVCGSASGEGGKPLVPCTDLRRRHTCSATSRGRFPAPLHANVERQREGVHGSRAGDAGQCPADVAPSELFISGTPMTLRTRRSHLTDPWQAEMGCENQVEEGMEDLVWKAAIEDDELGRTWGPPARRSGRFVARQDVRTLGMEQQHRREDIGSGACDRGRTGQASAARVARSALRRDLKRRTEAVIQSRLLRTLHAMGAPSQSVAPRLQTLAEARRS